MRTTLQLAALAFSLITAAACAQITDPNNLIAPPPLPIRIHPHTAPKTTDLQWLWQYTQPAPDGNETALIADPRFRTMLHDNLIAPQAFFRDGKLPLADVAAKYFGVTFNAVRSQDNRYISFTGCVQHECESQGLLWIDTVVQRPTVAFAASEWTTEGKSITDPDAEFNLWLFSNRVLDPEHPPLALTTAIFNWNSSAHQHIKTALVIDPDGTPHKIDPALLGATPAATK